MTNDEFEKLSMKLDKIDHKIESVHQGLYGIPGTDDMGVLGKLNDTCKEVDKIESRLTKVEVKSGVIATVISAIGFLGTWLQTNLRGY